MNGITKVIKASLRLDLRGLVGALIGIIFGSLVLYFGLGQEIMKDSGTSGFNTILLILSGMMIVAIVVIVAMSQAQSMGDILPTASKLGNKREDIAWGLLLKDIIISIIAIIILKLIVDFIVGVYINSPGFEEESLSKTIMNLSLNEALLKFVLNFLSITVIASVISYLLKVNPIIGCVIGLALSITFNSSSIIVNAFNNSLWLSLLLVIISQAFRFYVIKKIDVRF
ncbi:hypothetical protein JNO63_06060 [Anaerococcus sp. mt242]|uniref:hypothetical protein n=1 Tax=Anaerococcus sp. mt242 TaxID=2661917 RepID=UPI001934B347|nr:hypothetical protein [Anaerococcus sp. mt242]MBM0046652.1 hypothetical protein [Anaerococcus sp. mt242]